MNCFIKCQLILLLSSQALSAQDTGSKDKLNTVLEGVFDLDQGVRADYEKALKEYGSNSKEYQHSRAAMIAQDSVNQSLVFEILDAHGWIGKGDASQKVNKSIFYVIQHAQLDAQLKYAPLIDQAFNEKKISASEYAMFVDRLRVKQFKNQLYGTQSAFDNIGNSYVYPIEDPEALNVRREKMGLDNFDNYLKSSNLRYSDFPKNTQSSKVLLIGHFFDAQNASISGVEVWHAQKLIGKTDINGFFFIYLDKKPDEKLKISFKKDHYKPILSYPINGSQDFYEIYVQLKINNDTQNDF